MTRTAAERAAIARDGATCQRCGRDLTDFPASVHHRQPKGAGGGDKGRYDRVENLIVLCGTGSTPHCHLDAHTASDRYDTGWLVHRYEDPLTVPLIDLSGRRFFLSEEGEHVDIFLPDPGPVPF